MNYARGSFNFLISLLIFCFYFYWNKHMRFLLHIWWKYGSHRAQTFGLRVHFCHPTIYYSIPFAFRISFSAVSMQIHSLIVKKKKKNTMESIAQRAYTRGSFFMHANLSPSVHKSNYHMFNVHVQTRQPWVVSMLCCSILFSSTVYQHTKEFATVARSAKQWERGRNV